MVVIPLLSCQSVLIRTVFISKFMLAAQWKYLRLSNVDFEHACKLHLKIYPYGKCAISYGKCVISIWKMCYFIWKMCYFIWKMCCFHMENVLFPYGKCAISVWKMCYIRMGNAVYSYRKCPMSMC